MKVSTTEDFCPARRYEGSKVVQTIPQSHIQARKRGIRFLEYFEITSTIYSNDHVERCQENRLKQNQRQKVSYLTLEVLLFGGQKVEEYITGI